jgi:hypothetical protein
MNIFYLDSSPKLAAQYHCDKHVVKMILESAQLLSTAHRVLDGELGHKLSSNGRKLKDFILKDDRQDVLYKATHVNHPCAVWLRESIQNYLWLYELFVELGREYTYRYTKTHLSLQKLEDILIIPPDNLPSSHLTPFAQAMPDECKHSDAVVAYRNYYKQYKSDICVWTKRSQPDWY